MIHKINEWKVGYHFKDGGTTTLSDEARQELEQKILRDTLTRFPGDPGDPDLCLVTIDIDIRIKKTHQFPSLPVKPEDEPEEPSP